MTFKANWEKSESQHQLPAGIIEKMVQTAYPTKQLKSSQIIAGGCANINIKIQLEYEEQPLILRIYLRDKTASFRERSIGALLKGKLPVPQILHIGDIGDYHFSISEFLPGITLRDLLLSETTYDLKAIMYDVGTLLTKFASYKFSQSGFFNKNLEIVKELNNNSLAEFSLSCLVHKKVKEHLSNDVILAIKSLFKFSPKTEILNDNLVHADFDPANILVAEIDGKWKMTAILDWEFAYAGSWLNDVANMLRYSHLMPDGFKTGFLNGITDNNFRLPEDWQAITKQYTLASLLNLMTRHDLENCPNIKLDLCNLINHVIKDYE